MATATWRLTSKLPRRRKVELPTPLILLRLRTTSSAPFDHLVGGPASLVTEIQMPLKTSIPPVATASGSIPLDVAPEVINLEGSSEGGVGSPVRRVEQSRSAAS